MSKKTTEQVYTYKLEIVPTFEPTKWEPGAWEVDKETKEPHFTGKPIKTAIGYDVVMIAYLNDDKLGIAELLESFSTLENAESYKEKKSGEVGLSYKPNYQAYPMGKIVS